MNDASPIVLFVYNRLWHSQQTVQALQKNKLSKRSELFIYSDGGKNKADSVAVDKVRNYIKTIDGFKKITIIERAHNWGLARSIIDGVTTIVNQYGKIIVLEDDIVTSPYFLTFMNQALDYYQNNETVISISGYFYPLEDENIPDTFFIKGADCWGWATWQRGWSLFEANGSKLLTQLKDKKLQSAVDVNNSYGYTKMLKQQIKGKNDSWAVRWYVSAFLNNKLTLYPKISYVQNIGNDKSGTHCGVSDSFDIPKLSNQAFIPSQARASENIAARAKISNYLANNSLNFFQKIFKRFFS